MFIAVTEKQKQIMLCEKPKLRSLMILNLKFLSEVYGSNKLSVKKTLSSASDLQIKILINVLHYVAAGDIKLTRNDFDTIATAKKTRYLFKNFKEKSKANKLLKAPRKEQLECLFKLSSLYQQLLRRLHIS